MTLTETTQALYDKEDELNIQELIAASKFASQTQTPQPPTPSATNTSGFNLHPEIAVPDKQLRSRKSKNKTISDNFNFGDASDMSLPVSHNGSTPSIASITNSHNTMHILSNVNIDNDNNPSVQNRSINASKNDRKQQQREKSDNREIPTGPPEMMKDPTTDSFSSHAYSWPIAFAVVPPMGALIYGKSDVWSDFLLLLLIAFYLYNIIKVPWELYYAARSRRVINENLPEQTADPSQEERRNQAAKELRRQELWALLLVVASPIIGGYALHGAKMYLNYDKYISHFNIVLFVFAAGIRPLMHIASLAKNRTLHLQEQVHYPSTEVELLKRRVQHLEYEFSQLRRGFATKRDISNVRDGFEPTLSQLNKAVRRYEKKEQYLRNYSEERFAYLETKLREYDTFIAYKLQEEQAATLSRSMMQVIFLPLNVTLTILGYAKYFLPRDRQKPMLQPAINSEEEKLNSEFQQEILSGSLQKY